MLTPTRYFMLIITLTLLPSLEKCAHNINTKLSQMCPTLAILKSTNKDLKSPTFVNVEAFLEYVTSENTEPSSTGTYGEVFISNGFTDADKSQTQQDAVKVMKIAEDQANDQDNEQNMLIHEVQTAIMIDTIDPEHLFFPELRYCVEITDEFKSLADKEEDLGNADHVMVEDGLAPFLISFQTLGMEFYEFLFQANNNDIDHFDLINRIQMAINLFRGIIELNKKFIHCDIKPENIMLSKLTEAQASVLAQKGLKILETETGEYYQIFYIDFGLSQNAGDVVDCPGGTIGYLPREYFDKNVSDDQSDIFSLGMTLINSEFTAINEEWLSNTLETSQKIREKGQDKFDDDDKENLKFMDFIKWMTDLIDKPSNDADVKERVIKSYNDAKTDIDTIFPDLDWSTQKPSSFMYGNINLFESFVAVGLLYL